MTSLRIFSYLPNPRVWKATIAARLMGVEVEVVGATPKELANWLWDSNPRPLKEQELTPDSPHARSARRGFTTTLFKTDEFLSAHPFGTVPAAFADDCRVGIFESNSILRAVARLPEGEVGLYGADGTQASRIDSFLDADLVFGREFQVYLLALQQGSLSPNEHQRMAAAAEFFFAGLEQALAEDAQYLVAGQLSIADIAVVCDFAQFQRERLFASKLTGMDLQPISGPDCEALYPRLHGYYRRLLALPAFAEDLEPYIAEFQRKLAARQASNA